MEAMNMPASDNNVLSIVQYRLLAHAWNLLSATPPQTSGHYVRIVPAGEHFYKQLFSFYGIE
jgi:hypothetical protein